MRSFFKIFFASFLALVVFVIVFLFFIVGYVSSITSNPAVEIGSKAVLVLDLSESFAEKPSADPLAAFSDTRYNTPGLFDVIRMIRYAKTDSSVRGIYIKAGENANGLGSTEEIRNALLDFKKSGKFIYAYGDVISLKAYYAGNIADKIYCNPKGGWNGRALLPVHPISRGVWINSKYSRRSFTPENLKAPLNPCVQIK